MEGIRILSQIKKLSVKNFYSQTSKKVMQKEIRKKKNTFHHNEAMETFSTNVLGMDVVYLHSSILGKHNLLEDGRAYHLS